MARHTALGVPVLAALHQSIKDPWIKVLLRIIWIDGDGYMGDRIEKPSICRVDRERVALVVDRWLPVVDVLIDGIDGAEKTEPETSVDGQTRCHLEIVLDVRLDELIALAVAILPAVLLKAEDPIVDRCRVKGRARRSRVAAIQ